jgi:uncharacterized membrane protein YcaP (DUF421 family)
VLVGEVPGHFYIEIVFRIAFIYLVLMIAMRLMGKKMASQLNSSEMAAMVSLAAATGIPILAPDRGLLPVLIIAIIVVGIERLVSWLSANNQRAEKLFQGDISSLVKNGVLQMDEMKKTRISRERLFAQLRSEGVVNLGAVKRLYFESGGSFSIVEEEERRPGLSLIPDWDEDFCNSRENSGDVLLCRECGNSEDRSFDKNLPCSNCGVTDWIEC